MHPTIALRVLVVEPYDDFRHVLAQLLELMGCTVQTAGSATEALEQATTSAPDVVLAELDLRDADGAEFAASLRLLPLGEGMTLIAMSGRVTPDTKALALEAGFDYFLAKPITSERVAAILLSVVK